VLRPLYLPGVVFSLWPLFTPLPFARRTLLFSLPFSRRFPFLAKHTRSPTNALRVMHLGFSFLCDRLTLEVPPLFCVAYHTFWAYRPSSFLGIFPGKPFCRFFNARRPAGLFFFPLKSPPPLREYPFWITVTVVSWSSDPLRIYPRLLRILLFTRLCLQQSEFGADLFVHFLKCPPPFDLRHTFFFPPCTQLPLRVAPFFPIAFTTTSSFPVRQRDPFSPEHLLLC